MKKTLTLLLACLMVLSLLAACTTATPAPPAGNNTPGPATETPSNGGNGGGEGNEDPGGEETPANLPEGVSVKDGYLYFDETKTITVRLFDRAEGGTPPESNIYAQYIKDGVLRDHNINVEFKITARRGEDESLGPVLATQTAPDVCVTYNYPVIQEYAEQRAVIDLYPYLTEYKEYLPNMWGLLGDTYLFFSKNPDTNDVWAIEGIRFGNYRIGTFAREDWMKKLSITSPTTIDEFEVMITAFRDNAELLLGSDADKMIPWMVTEDVGWTAEHMLVSYIPDGLTDKERYTLGFDDRHFLMPNYKEGVRKLNEFYNKNLLWRDFPLHSRTDTIGDDYLKAGYVGAFLNSWDYPYRLGGDKESMQTHIKKQQGEDAAYLPIMPFQNDAGKYVKFLPSSNDRKIFFPFTNKEPLASIVYVDWISRFDVIKHLAIGHEGINHVVNSDGSITTIQTTEETYDYIINSLYNIDYTITFNGLDLGDPALNAASMMSTYIGTEPRLLALALEYQDVDRRELRNNTFGTIHAESGKSTSLRQKRDNTLATSIVASVSDFDRIFDASYADYMSSGGTEIIAERTAAWEKYYGSANWYSEIE
jgi:putative aldouronate transport system substrate-binding protein